MPQTRNVEKLIESLDLVGVDVALVRHALKHPSYVREAGESPSESNQRLEFLGDTVLDLVLADRLWREAGDLPEGQLTKMKSSLVREHALARVGRRLRLGEYLLLGRGESESGGRDKPSLIADAVEALIAAVYVSAGLECARTLILEHFEPEIRAAIDGGPADDPKTRLQELLQEHQRELPEYRTEQAGGPAHEPSFHSECWFLGQLIGTGSGGSKREAEKSAAADALAKPDLTDRARGGG